VWFTTVGIDITPSQVKGILFSSGNQSSTPSFILNNSFIQFEDISAKFALSGSVWGTLNLEGVGALGVDKGTFDLAIGLGLDRISGKNYFSDLTSVALSLRDNASWQKIGLLDVSLPLSFDLDVTLGSDFDNFLETIPDLKLIIAINDDDLFSNELPSVKLDLDLL
jgi:hypothetical protein